MRSAPSEPAGWQVICLCAQWCGVCRQWNAVFDALKERFAQVAFEWVDVEDQAGAMGDVEIETFPTLLVAQGDAVLFFGPVQPSSVQVARLLDRLVAGTAIHPVAGAQARALLVRLRTVLLLKR